MANKIQWSSCFHNDGYVITAKLRCGEKTFVTKQYIDHWMINDSGLNYIPITIRQMTDKMKLKSR
jgi:uncharacterized protein YegJ (DUF2314 family)